MKAIRCLSLLVLLMLPVMRLQAQSVTSARFFTASTRYSVAQPEGWVGTTDPIVPSIQVFESENLTLADSQATLDWARRQPNFDPFVTPPPGAMVIGVAWPTAFMSLLEMDTSMVMEMVLASLVGDIERKEYRSETLSGQQAIIEMASQGVYAQFLVLLDKSDNLLLLLSVSNAALRAETEAIIESLDYQTFPYFDLLDPATITMPTEIVPDMLQIQLPEGWWVMDTGEDAGIIAVPELSLAFFQALSNAELTGTTGLFMMAVVESKADLPPAAIEADGRFNPDVVTQYIRISVAAGMLGENVEIKETRPWVSEQTGERGVLVELQTSEINGMHMSILILDAGADFVELISASPADQWGDFSPILYAIYETAEVLRD